MLRGDCFNRSLLVHDISPVRILLKDYKIFYHFSKRLQTYVISKTHSSPTLSGTQSWAAAWQGKKASKGRHPLHGAAHTKLFDTQKTKQYTLARSAMSTIGAYGITRVRIVVKVRSFFSRNYVRKKDEKTVFGLHSRKKGLHDEQRTEIYFARTASPFAQCG